MNTGFLKRVVKVVRTPMSNIRHSDAGLATSWINDSRNAMTLKSMGMGKRELKRLKSLPERFQTTTRLFAKPLSVTSPFWYLHGLKELFIDETYKFRSATTQPLIIDCGSNIGLSIIYFKRLFPGANIIGFEPDPAIFKVLEKNISAFGFDNISLIEKAVWIENTNLHFRSDGSVGGSINTQQAAGTLAHTIRAARLRDYLSQRVDFLKIDIEGPEDRVIADCAGLLGNVQNLFIEYHSLLEKEQSLAEILGTLTKSGFRYYIKEAWENMHHPFIQKKGIFYDLQLNIFAYRK